MRYLPLIALLLATPAGAETYTDRECETLEIALSDRPCSPVGTNTMARRFTELGEAHPKTWGVVDLKGKSLYSATEDRFSALSQDVCDGKITALDVLHRYCPDYRPKP
jgi:hypothetical protein